MFKQTTYAPPCVVYSFQQVLTIMTHLLAPTNLYMYMNVQVCVRVCKDTLQVQRGDQSLVVRLSLEVKGRVDVTIRVGRSVPMDMKISPSYIYSTCTTVITESGGKMISTYVHVHNTEHYLYIQCTQEHITFNTNQCAQYSVVATPVLTQICTSRHMFNTNKAVQLYIVTHTCTCTRMKSLRYIQISEMGYYLVNHNTAFRLHYTYTVHCLYKCLEICTTKSKYL